MKTHWKMLLLAALIACFASMPACMGNAADPVQEPELPLATAGDAAESVPAETAGFGTVGAFSTQDTHGNDVTEAVFQQADVTMLNVWATFCGYCIREMPDLTALNQEFADQGFQVLGLVGDVGDYRGGFTEADMAAATAIMEKAGAGFPTLMPSGELIGSVLSQVPGYPTTFFVDHEGNLLGKPIVGAKGEDFWRKAIEAYLAVAPKQEAKG